MNQDEKRIKIAEACGWEKLYKGPEPDNRWMSPNRRYCIDKDIPDYFNDLNAMHEAEKVLKDHEIEQYNDFLGSFLWSGYPASRRNFHATAAQRAEAFGRTLELWT